MAGSSADQHGASVLCAAALIRACGILRAPPRVAYELTADGRELAEALRLLARWGARHADLAWAPRHAACGTPVEARW